MGLGLSTLGVFHTLIGILAIGAAIRSYVMFGKINLAHSTGKIYFYGTVITSLSALGIFNNGGFNIGHIFSLFIVVLVVVAYYLHAKKQGNNKYRFFENFFLSFSFFLSWIPTINETFNRIPVSHPLANGPNDPLIGKTILGVFALFILGSFFQIKKQRRINMHNE